MNIHPFKAGFLQAAGLSLYIGLFTTVVNNLDTWAGQPVEHVAPVLAMMLFLTLFVFSALVCGSMAFAYPVTLLFSGNKLEAIKTIVWTAVWLFMFGLIVGIVILLFGTISV